MKGVECKCANGENRCLAAKNGQCPIGKVVFKAHGPLTGYCVPSDRPHVSKEKYSCEVESWCPIEVDRLPLGKTRALMQKAEDYTVFIKNSVAFPYFGAQFVRNNLIGNNGRPCLFKKTSRGNNGCQIFRLGDMVELAGGNFSKMAIKGGVVCLAITWNCNLDRDFMTYCLPVYSFRILDDFGWNFRHAKYHEEHRRSLYKMYGIKFIVTVEGRGGKFNLKNTILNVGSGLALLGVSTIICDFLLMYIKEKGVVKRKKYDYIDVSELYAARAERKNAARGQRSKSVFGNMHFSSFSKRSRNSAAAQKNCQENPPGGGTSISEDVHLKDSSSMQTMLPRDTSSQFSVPCKYHSNNSCGPTVQPLSLPEDQSTQIQL